MTNEQLIIILSTKRDLLKSAINNFKETNPELGEEQELGGFLGSRLVFPCLEGFVSMIGILDDEIRILRKD